MESPRTLHRPPLAARDEGQSLWLDYLRRALMTSGKLERLIEEDALRGLTSNPSIFQKAISAGDEYDEDIADLIEEGLAPSDIYERLAVEDVQRAADIFRPVYEKTGYDGVVSLGVSPRLAHDTEGTIEEARHLWHAVDRPNLLIKVPGTEAGIPAIEQLLSEGINVNATLLFSVDHYKDVAKAYLRGLHQADDPSGILSVASFFVSRVAREVDHRIEQKGLTLPFDGSDVAIANAKQVYQCFRALFDGDDFDDLRDQGAFVQRPLWASTSTKDPTRSDVLYVDALIGNHTVNTMPPQTLDAFRQHGTVHGHTIDEDLDHSMDLLDRLAEAGIDLDEITATLQDQGVESFQAAHDTLITTLEEKRDALAHQRSTRPTTYSLGTYEERVEDRLQTWREADVACRLWRRDPTLWADEDTPEIINRLGWLDLPTAMQKEAEFIMGFAEEVKDDFDDVVVLGMGGSSLAPDVFGQVFEPTRGYPRVTVHDSTHPDAVQSLHDRLTLERTLFVVASKSGTTTETISFFRYFWNQVREITDRPGAHFVATTDEASALEQLAEERDFRKIFRAPADVGGRYSALTPFGLVPAALMGLDLQEMLDRAWTAKEASAFCVDAPNNSGLELGAVLGELALAGRDKVTFVTSPTLESFPAWQEQLIAESLGKDNTGIVPVADEPLSDPDAYGDDRVFVYFSLNGEKDAETTEALDALEDADHPVLTFELEDRYDLTREMYRWEMGVAMAGACMGVHPFNQPNVEAAKRLARSAMQSDDGQEVEAPTLLLNDPDTLEAELRSWIEMAEPASYIAVQAYLAPTPSTTEALRELVATLRNRAGLATTLGVGPRFLHSTGQLHKGGPPNGLFLQIVDAPAETVPVPETDYSFRELISAQSVGDYQALRENDRTVLRLRASANDIPRIQDVLRGILS